MDEASLLKCCGSARWAKATSVRIARLGGNPTGDQILTQARLAWWRECSVSDWLEAFAAHPRIGNVEDMRKRFDKSKDFAAMSEGEQSEAMRETSAEVLEELARLNDEYELRFGHIFIIFAQGKSAQTVLAFLKQRIGNSCTQELRNAAVEQMKITELRLRGTLAARFAGSAQQAAGRRAGRILEHVEGGAPLRSPITSHILDISVGKPASGVPVVLEKLMDQSSDAWEVVGRDVTNADGRCVALMQPSDYLPPGTYRVCFDTTRYYYGDQALTSAQEGEQRTFYPSADVVFEVRPSQTAQHFHVPLLLSPFGYSTYRGS